MMAAPKAWTTSRVSRSESSWMNGANSTPERAAKAQPSIQLKVVTRRALAPTSSVSSRSPTTARVWRPRWLRRKNQASPIPATTATATTIVWSMPTFTPGSR